MKNLDICTNNKKIVSETIPFRVQSFRSILLTLTGKICDHAHNFPKESSLEVKERIFFLFQTGC